METPKGFPNPRHLRPTLPSPRFARPRAKLRRQPSWLAATAVLMETLGGFPNLPAKGFARKCGFRAVAS